MEAGALVNAECRRGHTALTWACVAGHAKVLARLPLSLLLLLLPLLLLLTPTSTPQVLRVLRRHGAKLSARTGALRRTALMVAAERGQSEAVMWLLDEIATRCVPACVRACLPATS